MAHLLSPKSLVTLMQQKFGLCFKLARFLVCMQELRVIYKSLQKFRIFYWLWHHFYSFCFARASRFSASFNTKQFSFKYKSECELQKQNSKLSVDVNGTFSASLNLKQLKFLFQNRRNKIFFKMIKIFNFNEQIWRFRFLESVEKLCL